MFDAYALTGIALFESACYAGKLLFSLKFTRIPETTLIKVRLKQYESPECQKAVSKFRWLPTPLDIISHELHLRNNKHDLEGKVVT